MPSDFEALVRRWGFPKCNRVAAEECTKVTPGEVGEDPVETGTSTVSNVDIYPRLTQLLETVFETPGTIEQPLSTGIRAPFYSYAKATVVILPDSYTNVKIQSFPTTVDDLGDNPDMSNVTSHPDLLVRYFNTWCNPLWSFSLWFPPDSASSSIRWNLDGADSDIDYWYQVRQQHSQHPSLPGGQNTLHRSNVVSDPITQHGVVGLSAIWNGLPSWWGISRFGVLDRATHPAQFVADEHSESRWTDENGDPVTVAADGIYV
jgi:hypothetical protein